MIIKNATQLVVLVESANCNELPADWRY